MFSLPESEPILRDVFSGWETNDALFRYIKNAANSTIDGAEQQLPWLDSRFVYQDVLDTEYFGNHSGSKFCSPLVKHFIGDDGFVTDDGRRTLARIIVSKYFPNWVHLWSVTDVSYTPINNYDMQEVRTKRSADSSSVTTGTQGQEEISHGRTTDNMDYKYGINTDTDDPKPSDKYYSEEGGKTTTDSTSAGMRNRVGANEEVESTRRSGNIGVTTTQNMITEERKLWLWNYFDQVFGDLDRELSLFVYDSCRV